MLPDRTASRHLSDRDFRATSGAGTMEREGFLSYHAAEYAMLPQATIEPFAHYDREEVILSTKRQAERLLILRRPGWDSYGARPVNPGALDRATRLVLHLAEHRVIAPRLYPLSDGGVRLEWASDLGEVWIDIPAFGEPSCFFVDERTGHEWEGPLVESPGQIQELLTSMR